MVAAVVMLLGMTPGVASAQADRHRLLISLDTGVQTAAHTRTDRVEFDLFAEEGRYSATSEVGNGAFFGGGIGVRLWKRFGAGVSVSHSTKTSAASLASRGAAPVLLQIPASGQRDRRRTQAAADRVPH